MHREKLDNLNRMKANPVTVEVLGQFTNLNKPVNVDKKSEYSYPDTARNTEEKIYSPKGEMNTQFLTSKENLDVETTHLQTGNKDKVII